MVAEIQPGSPAPGVQVPETDQGGDLGFPPSLLPNNVVPMQPPYVVPTPASGTGTPAADINPPVVSPRIITTLRPPLQSAPKLNPGQASLQLPTGAAAGQLGILQQQNLVPVVPVPVLHRNGQGTDWIIPINLNGQSSVTVRAAYKDLHMEPGIRGIQISSLGVVPAFVVRCNATGFQHILPAGAYTAFLPLYMMKNMIDVTISVRNPSLITFPAAGVSCMLTTEEQVPFMVESNTEPGQTKIVTGTSTISLGLTITMSPDPNSQAYVQGASISGFWTAAPGTANALVTLANLFGGTGQLNWEVNLPASPIAGAISPPLTLLFSPPLVGNGPGVGPNLTVPAVTNVTWVLNMWGYEI